MVLMLGDAICIAACWCFVVWAYRAFFGGDYDPEIYLRMWPVIPSFVALNVLFRLYHGNFLYPAAPYSPVEEMRRLIGSSLIVHLGTVVVIVMMHQTMVGYSRVVVTASGLLTAAFAQPIRDVLRFALKKLDIGYIPVVVAGPKEATRRVVSALNASVYLGLKPVYVTEELRKVISKARKKGAKMLIACQDERFLRAQLRDFSEWFRYIEYVPNAGSFPVFGARAVSLDGIGGIEMVNQARMKIIRAEKVFLDNFLALLAFVGLSPFFVVVPILIKFTSRGPVFYRQKRLGQHGEEIRVWKFRSMYRDADERLKTLLSDPARKAEWEASFKLENDPRITPLGKLLRKTSIDEFPQLFNVFTGDMALVGPRPIVEEEVKYYGESYEIFSSVKPGITGLWQASGRSGTSYSRRVALDVEYVLNWSPWLDIWILFRTITAVLFMRGAC